MQRASIDRMNAFDRRGLEHMTTRGTPRADERREHVELCRQVEAED